ncbi:ferritin-like domain-containing protein [Streptococcus dentiloxodontae]
MNKSQIIAFLQELVNDMFRQANIHQLVAIQFGAQGFSKLEKKYQDHANEERDFAQQFANRILDLGGQLSLTATEGETIPTAPLEWLKADYQASKDGFAALADIPKALASDLTTYDLFKDYYKDEEENLYWTENQLNLIESIGYQNWLVTQL